MVTLFLNEDSGCKVMRRSMKEIRKKKIQQLRRILEKIKERPRTFGEIQKIINDVKKRTLHNYLAELKGLGLIVFDEKTSRYSASGSTRQVFSSKHDYELALEHSKRMVFGDPRDVVEDMRGTPLSSEVYNPSRIAFEASELAIWRSSTPLISHLKTGYFREIWLPLEEYRDLTNLPDRDIDLLALVDEGLEEKAGSLLSAPQVSSKGERLGSDKSEEPEIVDGWNDTIKSLLPKDRKRVEELTEIITKEIIFIIEKVRHGIPLKGHCEYCPSKTVTIHEEK